MPLLGLYCCNYSLCDCQLIGGLADEKDRWRDSVSGFDSKLVNIVGDVMVAAGAVAYLGPFTVSEVCVRSPEYLLESMSHYLVGC